MLILAVATCRTEALSDLATCFTPSVRHSPVAKATASDSSHPHFLFPFASDGRAAARREKGPGAALMKTITNDIGRP